MSLRLCRLTRLKVPTVTVSPAGYFFCVSSLIICILIASLYYRAVFTSPAVWLAVPIPSDPSGLSFICKAFLTQILTQNHIWIHVGCTYSKYSMYIWMCTELLELCRKSDAVMALRIRLIVNINTPCWFLIMYHITIDQKKNINYTVHDRRNSQLIRFEKQNT